MDRREFDKLNSLKIYRLKEWKEWITKSHLELLEKNILDKIGEHENLEEFKRSFKAASKLLLRECPILNADESGLLFLNCKIIINLYDNLMDAQENCEITSTVDSYLTSPNQQPIEHQFKREIELITNHRYYGEGPSKEARFQVKWKGYRFWENNISVEVVMNKGRGPLKNYLNGLTNKKKILLLMRHPNLAALLEE